MAKDRLLQPLGNILMSRSSEFLLYSADGEWFPFYEIEDALCYVWDSSISSVGRFTIWEGVLTSEWVDSGNGELLDHYVSKIRKRTFEVTQDYDCFDFSNFVEISDDD